MLSKRKIKRKRKLNKAKYAVRLNSPNEGYIYILYTGFENLYKIGMSRNVQQRLKQFKSSNPYITEIFSCKVSRMKETEKYLHLRWRGLRYTKNSGSMEIFRLEQVHLEKIKEYLLSESINN